MHTNPFETSIDQRPPLEYPVNALAPEYVPQNAVNALVITCVSGIWLQPARWYRMSS
jgi:hypothetical protein